jgi:hypothetical protein
MVNMFNKFESSVGSVVRGALCAVVMVMCGGVWGMSEDETLINPETSATLSPEPQVARPPVYGSDWYERNRLGIAVHWDGYEALQKDYHHEIRKFEETKNALETILTDIKHGRFKNPGMQLVLDYMHYWYYVDPYQVYEGEKTQHTDPVTGYHIWKVHEYPIQDLAAQILDELQQTGGTAYATLH